MEWTQGTAVNLTISSLTNRGDGIGHVDGRAVFVPDTVPGDEVLAKLVRVKPSHAFGALKRVLTPSGDRIRPACILAQKCGGCQWQPVGYDAQLAAKDQLVTDALTRLGHLERGHLERIGVAPILAAPAALHYRNKVSYPIAKGTTQPLKVGYFRKGSHKLVNVNQCPVQDERLDTVLQTVKQDLQSTDWPAYNERNQKGELRHLGLRIGRRTGQLLITLVAKTDRLPGLDTLAKVWMQTIPNLQGVCLNINPKRTNAIFGQETQLVAGTHELQEEFAGLTISIDSTSFFQVYTEQAERLLNWVSSQLTLKGNETLIDAYCGIGTLTLPLAKRVKQAIGIEVIPNAVQQANRNAKLNGIDNVAFVEGTVEEMLPSLPAADVVLLDPPRKGCERSVLDILMQRTPATLVYISCNPATLARDLDVLVNNGPFSLDTYQTADFFPQTAHVETAAILHLADQ
ncbi:MAG: 23S rRNA (uracil(1939)-C(5))-methyltransferase RlmD [Cyanobacteria bacterium P01_A01_bin.3]